MISILYIGNKPSHRGFTKGVIETLGPQLQTIGYKIFYAGEELNPILRLWEMLSAIIKYRKKVDYLLIDTYSTRAFWFAWLSGLFARLFAISYIPILHGGNMSARLKKSKWACKILFNYSKANVAVSGYLKKVFNEAGFKTIVIHNNIDISKYPFYHRIILKPRILWVRSFQSQYNPKMAVNVLTGLLKYFVNAELCMVGPDKDGSMDNFIEYATEKRVINRIKITGILSKQEWINLSTKYDIFINTTNVDNTPVSIIEAMALGLPVVSTNVGGLPYLINNSQDGFLVEPDNAGAMVEKIKLLISDNNLSKEITLNARKKIEEMDWEKVKTEWKKLLQ